MPSLLNRYGWPAPSSFYWSFGCVATNKPGHTHENTTHGWTSKDAVSKEHRPQITTYKITHHNSRVKCIVKCPGFLISSFKVSCHESIEDQSVQKIVSLTTAQVKHAAQVLKIAYSLNTRHKTTKVLSKTIHRLTQYQMLQICFLN